MVVLPGFRHQSGNHELGQGIMSWVRESWVGSGNHELEWKVAMENLPFPTGKYIYKSLNFPFSLCRWKWRGITNLHGCNTEWPAKLKKAVRFEPQKTGFNKWILSDNVHLGILLPNVGFPSSLSCSAAKKIYRWILWDAPAQYRLGSPKF